MVKHTQIIRRQKPTNCLSVFDHFLWLAIEELKLFLVTQYNVLLKAWDFTNFIQFYAKMFFKW